MTCCQKNAARGLAFANDMAGCRSGQNAILSDQKLLDAVRGSDLGNQLDDFRVPETTVTSDDES